MSVTPVISQVPRDVSHWDIELAPSAARTTTANGTTEILPGDVSKLRIQLDVTAVSGGTPSLTVVIEDSVNGATWNTVDTFPAKTGVSREVRNVPEPFARQVRARWTISGSTPSFTFSVKGLGRR